MRVGMPMGQGQGLDIRTSTRLAEARSTQAPELAGSLERARADVDSSPIRTHQVDPEVARAQRDRRLLEGHSTEELLLAAQASGNAEALPSRLAALFRQRPQAIAAAQAIVRKSGGNRLLCDGLAAAGSDAAVEALRLLAHDRAAASAVRVDAVTSFVLLQRPSLAAMRALGDLLDDADPALRSAARLISGSLARAGRGEHAEEAAALDQQLLSRYTAAGDAATRTELLSALGNSASAALLPALTAALRDPAAEVRIAAARALRLAEDPAVDGLLARTITDDRDPRVRAAAIFAAGFRSGAPFVDALVRAASSDAVEYVRADAIGLLRRQPDVSSKIAETLTRVAEHDPKVGIRRLAREALAANRDPAPRPR
jgi:HEAT repeat protein